jgi:hypothetical protein
VARIHIYTDDLLFGSRLEADLTGAGHQVTQGLSLAPDADLLVADLTTDPSERIDALRSTAQPVLAYYSHVETNVRELAIDFALVVPRSRMAREAVDLVARVLATAP